MQTTIPISTELSLTTSTATAFSTSSSYYVINTDSVTKLVNSVTKLVAENAVIVIGKPGCCMCHVMKQLLLCVGVNPTIFSIDAENEESVIGELTKIGDDAGGGDGRSVVRFPAVFVGGKMFGGPERVINKHIIGELVPILREAKASINFSITTSTSTASSTTASRTTGCVTKLVAENGVVVIGQRGCCMCHVVKQLFLSVGVNPTIFSVTVETVDAVIDKLKKIRNYGGGGDGRLEFPTVFVGGKRFGGIERVISTHIAGELMPILREAKAL